MNERCLLWLASILLVFLVVISPLSSADDDDEDEEQEDSEESEWMEDTGESLGEISAWLLGLTLVYFAWKRILPPIRKHLKNNGKKDQMKRLNKWNKKAIPIHTWLGIFALLTGIAHGLMMDESAAILWIAIALMGLLSITGGLMRWKWPPREIKKGARLLHMQRLISIIVVIFLLIGHEMV